MSAKRFPAPIRTDEALQHFSTKRHLHAVEPSTSQKRHMEKARETKFVSGVCTKEGEIEFDPDSEDFDPGLRPQPVLGS
jgi:hypothetical protein